MSKQQKFVLESFKGSLFLGRQRPVTAHRFHQLPPIPRPTHRVHRGMRERHRVRYVRGPQLPSTELAPVDHLEKGVLLNVGDAAGLHADAPGLVDLGQRGDEQAGRSGKIHRPNVDLAGGDFLVLVHGGLACEWGEPRNEFEQEDSESPVVGGAGGTAVFDYLRSLLEEWRRLREDSERTQRGLGEGRRTM